MDHNKHQSGGSSSSSFTENLFGPKDASSASSSGLFSSVFGPSSTVSCSLSLSALVKLWFRIENLILPFAIDQYRVTTYIYCLKALDKTLEFIMFSYHIGYLKQVVHSNGAI